MDFAEALSKYTSPDNKRIYVNRTPFPVAVTVQAIQTKTGEDFSFGKGGPDLKCEFFQLQAATFLLKKDEEVVGKPSQGAEVWIDVAVQVLDPKWTPSTT
jgi:hypothetical protein